MGLFDKKYCDICKNKIGLLGNRKLEDGNLCKDCAKKLSPWCDDRRHSTVQKIAAQLEYREKNKEVLKAFNCTKTLGEHAHKIYVDEEKGQFVVARNLNDGQNHDVIPFSQLTSCRMDREEHRKTEYEENEDGEREVSGYEFEYDYFVMLYLSNPYFDDIRVELNNFRVGESNWFGRREMEQAGNEIVAYMNKMAAMAKGTPMGMTGGTGMNANMAGGPNIQRFSQMGANQNMNAGAAAAQSAPASWTCSCGNVNRGRFCMECGAKKPETASFRCDKCGWQPPNPNNVPRFCPECGDPFDQNDMC